LYFVFSERELTFTFAICYRPSVRPSVVCLWSVTFVRPTQAVQIFGNISMALGTLVILDIHWKFHGDCPRGTPPPGELNTRVVAKYSDFGPIDAKCIVVTRVCVCVSVCLSVCLSAATCLHYCTDPDVTWGSGRSCPRVVHYWADLQSMHGLRCYGNITRTRNVSEYILVLAVCLVIMIWCENCCQIRIEVWGEYWCNNV